MQLSLLVFFKYFVYNDKRGVNLAKNKRKMRSSAFFSLVILILLVILLLQFWFFEVFSLTIKIIVLIVTLAIGLGFTFYLSKKEKLKPSRRLMKNSIAIVLVGILTYANIFYFQTNLVLLQVLANGSSNQVIQLVSLKGSDTKELSDVKSQTIGFQSLDPLYGHLNVVSALESFNNWQSETDFNELLFGSYDEAWQALNDGSIQAMTININDLKEIKKNHPDFLIKTTVLKQFKFKTEDISNRVDISKNTFNVLITGTDNREGEFDTSTRTDSVIVASINPQTMEVYLISLPRDLLIPVACKDNIEDKLTHVNNLGVECLQGSVEQFLDITINYYVEFNFESLIQTVDILKGVQIDVQYSFCELDSLDNADSVCLEAGPQTLNGEQSLAYARHRSTVDDYHRANAQRQIIEAIARKMMSVEGFKNFSSILAKVAPNIKTNFSRKEIYSGISLLSKAGSLNITQQLIEGEGENGHYLELHDFYAFVHVADEQALLQLQQSLKDLATHVKEK